MTRTFSFDGARTVVARRPAPALGPPLRGGLWLNFNGCCGLSPHRVALAPVDGTPWLAERHAADFVRIDARGRGGARDLTKSSSFFGFGQPIISVAPGRVVRTENGLPSIPPLNEPPGDRFTTRTTLGNNVVVRHADGRYALYAHLRRGTVQVRRARRCARARSSAASATRATRAGRTCTSRSRTASTPWPPTACRSRCRRSRWSLRVQHRRLS